MTFFAIRSSKRKLSAVQTRISLSANRTNKHAHVHRHAYKRKQIETNKDTEKPPVVLFMTNHAAHPYNSAETFLYRLWNVSLSHALPHCPSFAARLSTPFDLRPGGSAVRHGKKHRVSRKVENEDLHVKLVLVKYCR